MLASSTQSRRTILRSSYSVIFLFFSAATTLLWPMSWPMKTYVAVFLGGWLPIRIHLHAFTPTDFLMYLGLGSLLGFLSLSVMWIVSDSYSYWFFTAAHVVWGLAGLCAFMILMAG